MNKNILTTLVFLVVAILAVGMLLVKDEEAEFIPNPSFLNSEEELVNKPVKFTTYSDLDAGVSFAFPSHSVRYAGEPFGRDTSSALLESETSMILIKTSNDSDVPVIVYFNPTVDLYSKFPDDTISSVDSINDRKIYFRLVRQSLSKDDEPHVFSIFKYITGSVIDIKNR